MKLWNDGAGESEFAPFHPFAGHKGIGDFLKRAGWALDEDHFHDVIMFELYLKRSDHLVDVLPLECGQTGEEIVFALVVKEGDRSGHHLIPNLCGMLNEVFGDHGGEGLGTAFKSPFLHHAVQSHADIWWERDADSGDARL